MKIIDYSDKNKRKFEDMDKGCVFKFAGEYYMKINVVIDKNLNLPCNAVNLQSGESVYFASDLYIRVIDCNLIVK